MASFIACDLVTWLPHCSCGLSMNCMAQVDAQFHRFFNCQIVVVGEEVKSMQVCKVLGRVQKSSGDLCIWQSSFLNHEF